MILERWRRPIVPEHAPTGCSCHNVSVTIAGRTVVREVSLVVSPGRWCSIAGPNGAGKTTLIRAIAGLISHDGEVSIGGHRMSELRPQERARLVALVPQQPVVPPGASVRDYVLLGRTAHLPPLGVESAADLRTVDHVIEELDLDEYRERTIASLSGGERQRAVIARALAQSAPILLLDEPTAGLDLAYQQEVLDLVSRLCRERELTVIATMHDLTLAGAYSDELVLMTKGRVVAAGGVDATLTEENLRLVTSARFKILHEGGARIVVPLISPESRRAR